MSASNSPQVFNSTQQVKQYAERTKKTLLIHEDYVMDVTSFAPHHPGGAMLLTNNNLANIQQQMKFHHPLTLLMANSMAIGSFKKQIKRIINPDQPLLAQIWNLDHQNYMKVINSPHWLFVPSPPMFHSRFLQAFTHNKWYSVPLVPSILVLYMFINLVPQIYYTQAQFISNFIVFIAGLFFFTLIEYMVHRFLFHSQDYVPDTKLSRYIHFLAHGIHHMLPNDPDRLVLPAPLQIVLISMGHFTIAQAISFNNPLYSAIFWAGFFVGYCTYDICHYALHHVDTTKHNGSYFHRLQRYHNQHHFGGEQAGYGVSSQLWDIILRTGFKKVKSKSK